MAIQEANYAVQRDSGGKRFGKGESVHLRRSHKIKALLRHCVKALGLSFEEYCIYEHHKFTEKPKVLQEIHFLSSGNTFFLMKATAVLLQMIGVCVCVSVPMRIIWHCQGIAF